ncbi:MAG: helix-turn-helix domain-containing protein [Bariatricus sp.]
MEFGEKLQVLRKQRGLTQEQLAEQLFVSRTAISKWESGRGYPGIESLKCISKFFSVSIDDLLSGEELIVLAESENKSNLKRNYDFFVGLLDIMVIMCIFLPLYGQRQGDYIYSVNLFRYRDQTLTNRMIYWVLLLVMVGTGFLKLAVTHFSKASWCDFLSRFSVGVNVIAVFFFTAAREPYVTSLLFLFVMIKVFLLAKQSQKRL